MIIQAQNSGRRRRRMSLQSSVVCVDADAEHAAMPVHEHELLLDQANHDLLH